MKVCGSVLLLVLLCVSNTFGGIRPSFSLDYCSWNATHIVVATEGDEIDGNLTVLESLKGDLNYSETVFIQELAAFKSESLRQVKEWNSEKPSTSKSVSGGKLILFLKKNPNSKELWQSADLLGDFTVSVVWIENTETFAFIQTVNPGSSILVEYGQTETGIRNRIYEITGLENSLDSVLKIEDKTKRAEQLERFANSDFFPAREKAFEEFEKCGKSALPVLRKMLKDESLLKIHGDVIKTLRVVGGREVGNELTEIVKQEMNFWKETAPKLEVGWWNQINEPQTETLRNRYSKVLEAIYQLKELKFKNCRKIVTQFRNFWRSLPQLEDQSGLDQMSEECDKLLWEIGSK
jgi:hypothetical protein